MDPAEIEESPAEITVRPDGILRHPGEIAGDLHDGRNEAIGAFTSPGPAIVMIVTLGASPPGSPVSPRAAGGEASPDQGVQ